MRPFNSETPSSDPHKTKSKRSKKYKFENKNVDKIQMVCEI